MEFKDPQPWAHQILGLEMAKKENNFALFMEMGTGKTRCAIEIIRHLSIKKGALVKALIFCPPIVCTNWRDEIIKYSNIQRDKISLLRGHNKDRLKELCRVFNDPHIIVTNYEALLMEDLFTTLKKYEPEVIIFDESHRLKDYKAKRSKLALELANPKQGMRPNIYLLSGSPVLNSPLDLFHQFRIMDGGQTFGDNFFAFRGRYFVDKNAGMPRDRYFPNYVLKKTAVDEINKAMQNVALRVEKKDCLDLPPMVLKTIKIPMGPEQKSLYEKMKKDFVAVINDKACVATMAMVKGLRLMQIASGFIKVIDKDGEEEEIELSDNPKLEAVEELLRELTPHHKVIVWCVFKKNYAQIKAVCKKIGIGFVEVHGEVSDKSKQDAVVAFNTNRDVRVFIGHPGSGGIGINLVVASYSIFYSRTFSLEQSIQAEARNYRGGSKEAGHEKITRIDLVAEDSIEEYIVAALNSKQEISLQVLKDLSGQL